MKTCSFDVIIIGAGPAGVAAAGALAGTGISVALIETGVYAGAENWSGCVYFTENLAEQDCFGAAAVETAPFERRIVRRGTLVHNGLDEAGIALTDAAVFPNSFTVLRPIFDAYFADLSRRKGAHLLTGTTVTSLLRRQGRVVGVQTDKGPLYAAVVFLAEGDASHLVRSERLERIERPHFLQGVKAVLSLPPHEIERRFDLEAGEGAAYELVLRDPAVGGRTARLHAGGFLYTNRDSLSLGTIVPLENLARHYRGDHGLLLEWLRSLPGVRDLAAGSRLSGWGAKLIRSGGWRERPLLVEDGLAVGGAAAGLGIDIPFPNFTGPATATGLFFGRAVRQLLKDGRSLDARNLDAAYLEPLLASVYGRNAVHLARWPAYFSRSQALFGLTADILCGAARFLTSGSRMDTARYLRGRLFTPRAAAVIAADAAAALRALRLGLPLAAALGNPATWLAWLRNLFRRTPPADPRLRIVLRIGGRDTDARSLPWPAGGLLARLNPALARAITLVYANDGRPFSLKSREALRTVVRALSPADLVILPAAAVALGFASLATAVADAFRFYVLRTPAETMLAEPVMAYDTARRAARDIETAGRGSTVEARLAENTYRVGTVPHIRLFWPSSAAEHPGFARSPLWWICPARVYTYDVPLAGRGRAAVNWENCIKCETCWRSEPRTAMWGRLTDHKLIYRAESAAMPLLLDALRAGPAALPLAAPAQTDDRIWYAGAGLLAPLESARLAVAAFRSAVLRLPAAADRGRRFWPRAVGTRLVERLETLAAALENDGRRDFAGEVRAGRADLAQWIDEEELFRAVSCADRLDGQLRAWTGGADLAAPAAEQDDAVLRESVALQFPERLVKEWEDAQVPGEWTERIRSFAAAHRGNPLPAVRALASACPALALVAGRQLLASQLLALAGREPLPGICATSAPDLAVLPQESGVRLRGTIRMAPLTAATKLLVLAGSGHYLIDLNAAGVNAVAAPAIGFRAAGLADVALDCEVPSSNCLAPDAATQAGLGHSLYLAVALGAADYLSRRTAEHAMGRVQFPGQMLDTAGRDGIAKLGAVKALLARIYAWRLLLETLYDAGLRGVSPEFGLVCSAAAAVAGGPENGCLSYDAGQVFGGFAYSEDDLLSRFYRDSSLFRFLPPGYGAAEELQAATAGIPLERLAAGELGSLASVQGSPMAALAAQWHDAAGAYRELPSGADRRLSGEAAAVLAGIRGLIIRVERDLDRGAGRESDAASIEVLLDITRSMLADARLSAGRGGVPPGAFLPVFSPPPRVPLDLEYEAFCDGPGPRHRSGDFLHSVFDRRPRYVPEMQLHDFWLRARWTVLADWFKRECGGRSWDGMPFERHVERLHDLPAAIVQAVKERKWLATSVPRGLGGLGWRKADYYVLNAAAGTFGDASVCLLIMASTSIGTTPVLLGLEDELPRVREELEPLAADDRVLGEIGLRIRRITASLHNPDPARMRKEYETVMALVDARIRRTRVVKYLAANFLRAFYGAGVAGSRGDLAGFGGSLRKASELFDRLAPDVHDALAELPRRERSHRLFLRSLGQGGVSAFALTEPTAGSDSGGVRTTAVLRSAALTALPDGRYAFPLREGDDRSLRHLIDADRIEFTDQGMAYRAPDGTVCPIRTDRSVRSYAWQGQDRGFHDIAQVRASPDGPRYEFYSITGAKMWITNGGIATQFSLFAQTPEGVTGFMVDRHAEGLTVGADERKMGQRGSPTNELSLDEVRVPREAVIGYEGHGQVNALETLNVGRCGLAVVSGALARKVMDEALRDVPPSGKRDALLGEAAAVLFGGEALAHYLIGLFDRPHESVRMESAIAKYLCAEDLHEILTLAERAYGPDGQTERRLLEKARRDSRILNIYEGTNEVQRFLILKDVIARASDWPALPERIPERPGDHRAEALARWKNRIRGHVLAAAKLLGDAAWSDAMLQPGMFLLAEMAGEVLRLECIWYRMEWLEARRGRLGAGYVDPLLASGGRAAARALARLDHLNGRYRSAWSRIAEGRSLPEVIAADSLLDGMHLPRAAEGTLTGRSASPTRILCILRVVAELSPRPRIVDGRIEELVRKIDPRDRTGLDQALALTTAVGRTSVDVLLRGGTEDEYLLHMAAADADVLYRIDAYRWSFPASVADAVRQLHGRIPYDLIVAGARTEDDAFCLPAYLAGALGVPYHAVASLSAGARRPAVFGISETRPVREPDISRVVVSFSRPVHAAGATVPLGTPGEPRYLTADGSAAPAGMVVTAAGAGELIKAFAAASRTVRVEPYQGPVAGGSLTRQQAVWVMIESGDRHKVAAVVRAGRTLADALETRVNTLITSPRERWTELIAIARHDGADGAFCLDTGGMMLSSDGRREVLRTVVRSTGTRLAVAGVAWTEAFAAAAGGLHASEDLEMPVLNGAAGMARREEGDVAVTTVVYEGKLLREERIRNGTAFVTVADDAEFPEGGARPAFEAVAIDLPLSPDWTAPLPPSSPPSLNRAEVIIDVGYGVRDQAGLGLARELQEALEGMGLAPMLGATRKVTQDLKLLPLDSQIGQTGVRVNPKLIICLGVSGAPQHVDWIGARAEVLCFNKDPEAPLMKLNRTRPAPRVHPVAGDLFVTVRELIDALKA